MQLWALGIHSLWCMPSRPKIFAFKWMKQQFEEEQFDLINVGTDWQPPTSWPLPRLQSESMRWNWWALASRKSTATPTRCAKSLPDLPMQQMPTIKQEKKTCWSEGTELSLLHFRSSLTSTRELVADYGVRTLVVFSPGRSLPFSLALVAPCRFWELSGCPALGRSLPWLFGFGFPFSVAFALPCPASLLLLPSCSVLAFFGAPLVAFLFFWVSVLCGCCSFGRRRNAFLCDEDPHVKDHHHLKEIL
jgi:hypothetical protein